MLLRFDLEGHACSVRPARQGCGVGGVGECPRLAGFDKRRRECSSRSCVSIGAAPGWTATPWRRRGSHAWHLGNPTQRLVRASPDPDEPAESARRSARADC